jgi:hypothetical protein
MLIILEANRFLDILLNCFYKAEWELQTADLKPPGSCRQLFKSLLRIAHKFTGSFGKTYCSSHTALEQLLHTTARGFRKICENSKAFCKR